MATDPDFLEFTRELFADLGEIRTTGMFGGSGLYIDNAMFAMIIGDTLFMKADKPLAARYAAAGSTPFQYDTKTGPRTINGLMSLPDTALDDPATALDWARQSLVPAIAAATKKQAAKHAKKFRAAAKAAKS
ncbi:MAG: TfoX/Sxy family protein [Rhodobacterales bacterium]|nr:TfoX/Sxy family protein [Rhodobacterales bacterium]